MEKKDLWLELMDALQDTEFKLSELHALIDVLHTATDGRDEISLETIGDYTDVMTRQAALISADFQKVYHAAMDLNKEQKKQVFGDEQERSVGDPIVYPDPETGERKVFQDPEI